MTSLRTFILILLGALAGNVSAQGQKPASKKSLKQLVQWMTGDFSSLAQSQRDSDFFDIRLHIRPIWKQRKGEHWLYVEQATATAENKPYRQRIYRVDLDETRGFKSIVYTLPDQEKWVGAYKKPALFDTLDPSKLTLRDGCTVYLQREQSGSFTGATQGQGCESSIRGAKYASSKVTITKKMLLSWDQGFNEKGDQVWGAKKGGYEFVKM